MGVSVGVLAAAVALYVALAWRQSDAFMVWDEETMVHSAPAPRVLAAEPGPGGRPRFERSCAGPGAPAFVLSSGRPRLGVCARGRLWPLMIAPYFSGVFYWPFGLLAPLHHDNVFALRKLTLLMGAASLLLTFELVRRHAGHRTAALAALAVGASPCFVFLHAVLVHFETLPWAWLVAAMLVLSGAGPRAPSTRRLAAAGLLLGLSVLANLKTVVLIAPIAAVAWRLGYRGRQVRPAQWAAAAGAAMVPMVPMVVVYLLPAQGYGDKSTNWADSLASHLLYPERVVPSTRDMVLWWSNVAYYFRGFVAHARLNVVALALASAALAFVLVDAARTLRRGAGDAVTAACGACLASYVVMVALLYDEFPANYTPLHAAFGVTFGVAVARASAWLGERLGRPSAALPLAVLMVAPFAWSSAQTIEASRQFHLRTNARTERALVAFLRAHPEAGASVVTVDARLAGVVDSLSDGAVVTTQAQNYFQGCNPRARNPDAQACLRGRWAALLSASTAPLRVVMPLDVERWRSGQVSLEPSLVQAARGLGRGIAVERTFDTAGALPAIALYRVAP